MLKYDEMKSYHMKNQRATDCLQNNKELFPDEEIVTELFWRTKEELNASKEIKTFIKTWDTEILNTYKGKASCRLAKEPKS